MLKTVAAIDGAALCGTERNGCLAATLRANRRGLFPARAWFLQAIPLGFAGFATLGEIPEVLAGKEKLLACRKDEIRAAFCAFQNTVRVLHHEAAPAGCGIAWNRKRAELFVIASALFSAALACQCFFNATFFARFHVVGMLLDVLNNIFLLDFSFKATKGIFQRLTFLESDFRQPKHPLTV